MSELKCPFCQQELRPVSNFDNQDKRCVWYCPDCATNKRLWVMANEQVWRELIRTHKALDVAINELTKIKDTAISVGIGFFMTAAISALEKIKTSLEQKDIK